MRTLRNWDIGCAVYEQNQHTVKKRYMSRVCSSTENSELYVILQKMQKNTICLIFPNEIIS